MGRGGGQNDVSISYKKKLYPAPTCSVSNLAQSSKKSTQHHSLEIKISAPGGVCFGLFARLAQGREAIPGGGGLCFEDSTHLRTMNAAVHI